jgi:hypothetical protein
MSAARSVIIHTYVFFLLVFAIQSLQAQKLNKTEMLVDLRYTSYALADDSMGGRLAGSKYDLKTANIICTWFKKLQLKAVDGKNYMQKFTFPGDSNLSKNSQNVIGRCGNKKGPVILIGAHYDHIGHGGKLSRSLLKNDVHNGADDNASGVAIMMELAKSAAKIKKPKYNYVFAAFSAHEEGLFGSKNMVHNNVIDTSQIVMMINLDMVGRYDSSSKKIFFGSNRGWGDTLLLKTKCDGFILSHKELPQGDHTAFDAVHIPVMYFTTGMHDDYHKVSDDAPLLNYEGMAKLTAFLFTFIKDIEKDDLIKARTAQ